MFKKQTAKILLERDLAACGIALKYTSCQHMHVFERGGNGEAERVQE